MSDIINVFLIVLVSGLWIAVLTRVLSNKFACEKTVKAEVIDKYISGTPTVFHGAFKREKYVVVFLAEGKKYAFCVSQFSYNEYRINEKGTLKFKGNRLISFK